MYHQSGFHFSLILISFLLFPLKGKVGIVHLDYNDQTRLFRLTMSSPILTIQYLEDSPDLARIDPELVINKLRAAAERLPFTHLIIGWHLPMPLLVACHTEADRLGMRFIHWQPLLAGDRDFLPDPSWQMVNLLGNRL